jgi:hypothetical protein
LGDGGKKNPPASQPAADQSVRQNLVETLENLSIKVLGAAHEAVGLPTTDLGLWLELKSLLERDSSVKEAIEAAKAGKYNEMRNHLEKLIPKLQRLASHPAANPGLQNVIEKLVSKIKELIREAPKAEEGTPS